MFRLKIFLLYSMLLINSITCNEKNTEKKSAEVKSENTQPKETEQVGLVEKKIKELVEKCCSNLSKYDIRSIDITPSFLDAKSHKFKIKTLIKDKVLKMITTELGEEFIKFSCEQQAYLMSKMDNFIEATIK